MADLTIRTAQNLGPLSLQVTNERGRLVPVRLSPLSSQRRSVTATNLAPGVYNVIATRPSGQTLAQWVKVPRAGASVDFKVEVISPNEFLTEAVGRGLVPSINPGFLQRGDRPHASRLQLQSDVGVLGDARSALRAIEGLARSQRITRSRSARTSNSALFKGLAPSNPDIRVASTWRLECWLLNDRWRRVSKLDGGVAAIDLGPGYLRTRLHGHHAARALSLVDSGGHGPFVIVPPFADGVDVSFLADGLTARASPDRVENPSAVRIPVAVALPRDPRCADLLAALTSGGLPGADALWEGISDDAFGLLHHKVSDPGAAALGAHFLIRFAARRAPVDWLENLMEVLPHAADGPTLLAWRYITAGGKQGAKVERKKIRSLLREASRRPVHLFGRSRVLLGQASRLYGPFRRARHESVANPRRPDNGAFLDVAAEAGGLEAFWGSSPRWPYPRSSPPTLRVALAEVALEGGLFAPRAELGSYAP